MSLEAKIIQQRLTDACAAGKLVLEAIRLSHAPEISPIGQKNFRKLAHEAEDLVSEILGDLGSDASRSLPE